MTDQPDYARCRSPVPHHLDERRQRSTITGAAGAAMAKSIAVCGPSWSLPAIRIFYGRNRQVTPFHAPPPGSCLSGVPRDDASLTARVRVVPPPRVGIGRGACRPGCAPVR